MDLMKLRFKNPTMTERSWILVAIVVFCLSAKAPRAFVLADDEGLDITTTEFDPSTRGALKFGDKCEMTQQCGFAGSICYQSYCTCGPAYMSTNHVDKCGKAVSVNESCFFNEQCEDSIPETECRDGRCICRFDKTPVTKKDGSIECLAIKEKETSPASQVNPAMYLILVVMALMFIIICVVLRLFSKARWRETRTIFNTPNPRLMNVSLLRDNKMLHGGERRGSRMSVRMPSRQPSMASLRAHSPNASIGSRRGSRISSSASATSNRSLQNHKIPEHHGNGHHTVVTNPNDLLNVNQQQHVHHQLLIHQQQERRRSSVQHASARLVQPHTSSPTQKPSIEDKIQDIEVEIQEVQPSDT